ncbi:MAG: hypothetical protein ACLFMX_06760 [Halobacteriales archaeon]
MSTIDLSRSRGRSARATFARAVFALCAAISILTTAGIVLTLLVDAVDFFGTVGVLDFLTGTT